MTSDFQFFDPKPLSDEELQKKQAEISNKIYMANSVTSNYDILAQLESIADLIESERQEREFKKMFDGMNEQFPEIIESDIEWLNEEERARSTRKKNDTNDYVVPRNLKKEIHAERLSERQQLFQKYQEKDRNPNAEPEAPKKRGRPRKNREEKNDSEKSKS